MNWLARLFRPRIELPSGLEQRLRAWHDLPAISEQTALSKARFIVVDIETSGLNIRKDHVLSIGACAVEALRVNAGERFEAILRQQEPSAHDSVLIHGIGPEAQSAGEAPVTVLSDFIEFTGKYPLVAFHASFDQAMLGRALCEVLGVRWRNPWLDLAHLAPALFPEARLEQASLDKWLGYFNLRVQTRHRAGDDAFATAELFLILLGRARASRLTTVSALHALGEQKARLVLGGGTGGV